MNTSSEKLSNGHATKSDLSYDEFLSDTTEEIQKAKNQMSEKGHELAEKAGQFFDDQKTRVAKAVESKPFTAVAAAFGIGLAASAGISYWLSSRNPKRKA